MPGFAIAVLLVLFASGAAQALTSANQPGATAQNPLPVIQVQKSTLVVGSEQDYPPFATGMTDATAGGFTVDLWKAVAAEAGLNYTIRVRPFHQILQEFKEGKIDVLINLAHSEERHQFADFTVPHVIVHGAIFVRKGESGIRSEDDFAGKSIIVLNADLAHDYAVSKGWGKQLVLVDTSAEGMRLLASGKHDAMLLSKLAGMQTLQALGLTNIEALKVKAGFSQKFAFAVQKGQSELLGKLNEGLALTKSNGTYNALYNKWFGVYEAKEVGLRDLLKYIIPVVVVFLGIAGYFFYRRQVERAAAEKKYRDLYDHAPDMLLSCEAKTATIIDCNQTLLDATGYSREELVGRSAFELYHPDCTDLARTAFQKFMDTKEVHGVELQVRRKDGSKVDVSLNASAACDEHGAILHSRSALRDITERKRAESALRESEARFRNLVETTSDWIWEVDENAVYTYASPKIHDILGYEVAEIIGKTPFDLMPPEEAKRVADIFGPIAAARTSFTNLENTNLHKDGHPVVLETSGVPVIDTEGKFRGYRGIDRDITERKEFEEELKRSNAELEQFGYAISHDMRQPLRMISSYLQLIETSLADQLDGEKRDYFDFAIDGAKRIDQMLVALLEYSRVGRMDEPSVWIESRAVLDEALLFLQPAIAEAQAKLDISGDWPRIFANRDEILRLVQNLMGNAVKFRVAGRAPEITVTSQMCKNEWHLCVADNGIGLIPDQIKRLFQIFQRLQLRAAYEGNGVGLALCRKIAEHHKGRIWAESAGERQGSKFYVVLPVQQEKAISAG